MQSISSISRAALFTVGDKMATVKAVLGLYQFDPAKGTFMFLMPVEKDKPGHRINDGHVDASGRVWSAP
jgi:sugar lactone lactonase YvrE